MTNEYRFMKLKDAPCAVWQGGVTYELVIGGPGVVYSERNFLYRVSSAVVDLEESVFTYLPDYDRLITPLDANLEISHNGGEPVQLRPLDVHCFDGAWETRSRGRARDFNLMLRKGRCTGEIKVYYINAGESIELSEDEDCLIRLFFCASGSVATSAAGEQFSLEQYDSLITHGGTISLSGGGYGAALLCAVVHPVGGMQKLR